MFKQSLLSVALALLPAPQGAPSEYVPAVMRPTVTVGGCLQRDHEEWILSEATLAGQKDTATYKLEGIGDARLAILEGKRVEATGAVQGGKPDPGAAKTTGAAAPAAATPLGRFEATAVKEATGTCP